MKINWKVRLRNKTFVISMSTLILSFLYQFFALIGVVPKVSENTVLQVVGLAINLLSALGVLIDPTQSGVSDSARALTYGTDEDVRSFEVKQ